MSVCNDMALNDWFRILKVREGSSWNVIKKSYDSLATEFHPYRNPVSPFLETLVKQIVLALHYL